MTQSSQEAHIPQGIRTELGHGFITTIKKMEKCKNDFRAAMLESTVDVASEIDPKVRASWIDKINGQQNRASAKAMSDNRQEALRTIDRLPEPLQPEASALCATAQRALEQAFRGLYLGMNRFKPQITDPVERASEYAGDLDDLEELTMSACEKALRVIESTFGIERAEDLSA